MTGQGRRTQFPRGPEGWSIVRWWRDHPRQGRLWVEVGIGRGGPGGWPNPQSSRDIDAVHIPDHPVRAVREWGIGNDELTADVDGRDVEIVEAKVELNADVIGQCLAGVDMVTRACPTHAVVTPVAVVCGEPDPALQWVCHRRGIAVTAYPRNEIDGLQQHGDLPPFQ